MSVKLQSFGNKVVLVMNGHLDTATSQQMQDEIQKLLAKAGNFEQLICDVEGVSYISSSGLRLLLNLAKRHPSFRVVEAQPEVYHVLDMTGFTKIMSVDRALRKMSVEGCEHIGSGGVGEVYRIDDDTIIKVFREGSTMEEVNTEMTMAKEAFVMGMPTAISFDVVRIDNQLGLVYELLRARTLGACLKDEPERIDEFAQQYASLFQQLHEIRVPKGSIIPSAKAHVKQSVHHIARYFDTASIDLMLQMTEMIPDADRLLHCDLQAKNAMIQDGEPMLIDMGEVGYGHPVIDLGNSYSSMVNLVGDYEAIIGLPQELGSELWMRMIKYYFKDEPADVVAHRIEQIDAVSRIRNFSWLALSDSFPKDLIRMCQNLFAERVLQQKDHLLEVCATLSDWKA